MKSCVIGTILRWKKWAFAPARLDLCVLALSTVCAVAVHWMRAPPAYGLSDLVKAGMSSFAIEQLKKLDTSDAETVQLVSAKEAGISDETCIALVSAAHQFHRPFTSVDSVNSLAGAGFGEPQILEIARLDKLDTVSEDAVTLRLIGLSDPTVQMLLQRHLHDQPTLSSGEIARLKNVGLTESSGSGAHQPGNDRRAG